MGTGRLAARAPLLRGGGSGASASHRLTLFSLAFLALLLVPATQALAGVTVSLAGAGSGTVTSTPAGIDCSNVPGEEREDAAHCSHEFAFNQTVELIAEPASRLDHWTGDAPSGTCNSGVSSPCSFMALGAFLPISITATFAAPSVAAPSVETGAVSQLGARAVTIEGLVNPEGADLESCFFQYLTHDEYVAAGEAFTGAKTEACDPPSDEIVPGTDAISVSGDVLGLHPNTVYQYRLVASGPGGEASGDASEFTTTPQAPSVQAYEPDIESSGAIVQGAINPNGSPVTYWFEYGPGDCAVQQCEKTSDEALVRSGDEPVYVAAQLPNLQAGTTYRIRLVAHSAAGATASSYQEGAIPGTEDCPNETIRQRQAATYLPDCMAFEQVSPATKDNQPAFSPSISEDGGRVLFGSRGALGETPGLIDPLGGDLYVSSRGGAGWTTTATSPPGTFGSNELGIPRVYSSDFGTWFSFQATQGQRARGLMSVFEAGIGHGWTPRSALLRPLNGDFRADAFGSAGFQAVSGDLSHLYIKTSQSVGGECNFRECDRWPYYLSGDPEPLPGGVATNNTYVVAEGAAGAGGLALLARDRDGKVWGGTCGSWVGGGIGTTGTKGGRNQGAVSTNGARVFFSTRPAQAQPEAADPALPECSAVENPIRILRREEGPDGVTISELLSGAGVGVGAAEGDDFFQGASLNGTRVYFTSERRLADTDKDGSPEGCSSNLADIDGCDLYLYEGTAAGGKVIQVSAGDSTDPHSGSGADVARDIIALSADGSHVYFAAKGVLTTTPNPEGAVAENGQPNLYLYVRDDSHPNGHLAFVGTLNPGDGNLFGPGNSFRPEATAVPMRPDGDGHVLVFVTTASLSAADRDGGQRDVYRYDATRNLLQCVSCRPGAPDEASGDTGSRFKEGIPPGPDFADRGQWVSEDGQTIAFGSTVPLVAGDTDGLENPYIWRAGSLYQLPGARGSASQSAMSPVVSRSGTEVAFESSARLVPQDGDSAQDIYMARAAGGFASPERGATCMGEACQGLPRAEQADTSSAATSTFSGRGNVPKGHGGKKKTKHHHRRTKHHRKRKHRGKGNVRKSARHGRSARREGMRKGNSGQKERQR